jgi:L,D-peptidoglycan transpeptidase YkuD (ErfK/YbiS/YcfS/YnhG family)
MRWSRLFGALAAALVLAGCAVVAIGMARAASRPPHRHHTSAVPSPTPRPAYLPLTVSPSATATRSPRTTAHKPSAPTSLHGSATPLAMMVASRTAHRVRGGRLPLHLRTHHAGQVITVVARSRRSRVATLQAWHTVPGRGWVRRGPRIRAYIGADGMTWHASESKSATPMGSFTLTRAFGHNTNPGTALPYLRINPADWWISQPGRLYNTHQRCWSHCPFTQGAPNEHLYYETPYYNYAVVIDYNTRNAPGGVKQGRGSAFFLHVTVGQPTAGCVAIPQARLVSIMQWLAPRKHPRILIGVG